jgi:hypothetical protein
LINLSGSLRLIQNAAAEHGILLRADPPISAGGSGMYETRNDQHSGRESIVLPDFLDAKKMEDGIGLCLSGGGFRAMLFHQTRSDREQSVETP